MKSGNAFHRRRRLFAAQDGRCALCGGQMLLYTFPTHPDFATFDHIKPLHYGGGRSAIGNVHLAHRSCNMKRGAETFKARKEELQSAQRWAVR